MIYSIGHSTLKEPDFLKLMRPADILIDVRSHPGSRAHPQFNKESFRSWLADSGKGYEWFPGLGGWDVRHAQDSTLVNQMTAQGVDLYAYSKGMFPKQRIAGHRAADLFGNNKDMLAEKPTWTSQGLFDYAWFMILPEFKEGLFEIMTRGKTENITTCCCECLWWKCHRSMIADAVYFFGGETTHIMPNGRLSPHSKAIGNRIERYPTEVIETWKGWKQ